MSVNNFPHSLEAEEAVIGAILLKGNDVFSKCNGWIRDSEAFYNNDLKTIWKSFSNMHRNGEAIDTITLSQQLKDKDLINPKATSGSIAPLTMDKILFWYIGSDSSNPNNSIQPI